MGSLYRPKYPHPEGEYVFKRGKRYKVSKIYCMKYRVNNRVICESTGATSLREAKRILARRMGAAGAGQDCPLGLSSRRGVDQWLSPGMAYGVSKGRSAGPSAP